MSSWITADRAVRTYQSAINRFARGPLLDLGCGTVPLYGIYRSKVADVVCVDWPSGMHNNSHVDIFADLNTPLHNIEVAGFGTVIASDVIEHLHTPNALFQTAASALEDGGHLILGAPFLYWIHEQPHDYHRYTSFALRRYCTENAFEVLEIVPWAGTPEVIAHLSGKALASWPSFSAIVLRAAQLFLGLGVVQKLSRVTMETMPLGYTLVAQRMGRVR